MFRYSIKDSFLILQTLVVFLLPVAMALYDPDFIWWILVLPLHVMLALLCSNTSVHHHVHWPTFNNKKLNSVYECFLSCVGMTSAQGYRNSHLIHHKFVNDPPVSKDSISVLSKGQNNQAENAWTFCFSWAIMRNLQPYKFLFDQKPAGVLIQTSQWRREMISILIFIATILFLNFKYGLWLCCVVYVVMQFLNAAWHYGEHWGAHNRRGDCSQDSVGIYSWWYNTFCFNSGLHQEHHYQPGVHWTQLDKLTSLLPADRVIVSGMHITNVPWAVDFKKLLFKL